MWKVSTLVLALGERVAEALAAVGENQLFGQLKKARSTERSQQKFYASGRSQERSGYLQVIVVSIWLSKILRFPSYFSERPVRLALSPCQWSQVVPSAVCDAMANLGTAGCFLQNQEWVLQLISLSNLICFLTFYVGTIVISLLASVVLKYTDKEG